MNKAPKAVITAPIPPITYATSRPVMLKLNSI